MLHAIAFALAYAIGSILFGPVVARRRGIDLYAVGSGNPGATNVERAVGRGAALVVLGLDGAKGLLATLLAAVLCHGDAGPIAMAGTFAVIGHCFPLTAPSRGGKGVATAVFALLGSDVLAGIASIGVYLAVRRATRLGSVGSLAAVLVGTATVTIRTSSPLAIAAMVSMLLLVIGRHRDNIARLRRGEEPRTGEPAPDIEED